ncbi:MAG: YHS domain-containing protein [Candidatus Korarchaeota archaeon]|nr:YHS domain-containing protein [Candidatus Korarchaeota archaeon]NIU84712.1 YHS domain-containing protein [Candidatus Thorarchaeota archaeon]NIW14714.1 YHS domain-containing protein [Candidatus Thorarchaeota archaeon]NIW52788.1 YHS domain-containing protein [Candidatus Korarchaeota archaeon]
MEKKAELECPVCGTKFLEEEFGAKTEHKGKEYRFCGEDCKDEFEENPKRYVEG